MAWQIGDQVDYALEGSIFVSGSLMKWLRDQMQLFENTKDTQAMAESVENTLFKAERKVVIQIYGNGALLSTSSVYRMTPSSVQEAEFALAATENVKVVVVDIQTQQQVDFCDVKKSVSRDLDDLF